MRENTQTSKRRRRRKHRKPSKLAYFLILLLVALCALAVCAAVFCKVTTITVSGKTIYKADEIVEASGIKVGTNLFLVKKPETEKKIVKELPFIASAKVRYSLPKTIKIEVTPAESSYAIKNGDKFILTDSSLKILDTSSDAKGAEKKIIIDGAKLKNPKAGTPLTLEKEDQLSDLKAITAAIKSTGIKKISEINITDGYQLSVLYDGRITILVGTPHSLDEKLNNAVEIVDKHLNKNDTGKLDVSTLNRRYIFTPQ